MATNLTPGTQQYGDVTNPTGLADSVTQDPNSPVENGRTAATSAYTTTASSGAPIGGSVSFGAVADITLVGTTSTKADGAQTGVATTGSTFGSSGATVTYSVSSNVASGTTVAAGGSGYAVGDTLTVVGDTGVTYTVASIS